MLRSNLRRISARRLRDCFGCLVEWSALFCLVQVCWSLGIYYMPVYQYTDDIWPHGCRDMYSCWCYIIHTCLEYVHRIPDCKSIVTPLRIWCRRVVLMFGGPQHHRRRPRTNSGLALGAHRHPIGDRTLNNTQSHLPARTQPSA